MIIDKNSLPPEAPRGFQYVTIYDAAGRILGESLLQTKVIPLQRQSGDLLIDGRHDGATHYVRDGVVVGRPVNPARLDGMTLHDLPVPCVIVIDSVRYDCDDDHAELDFTVPKTYQICVDAFPMLDATFEVTVE